MNIEIPIKYNDTILLRADESNYELCRLKRHIDKATGQCIEEWVPERYFATLGQALCRVLDLKVKASDAGTLIELRDIIKVAEREIMAAFDFNSRGNIMVKQLISDQAV